MPLTKSLWPTSRRSVARATAVKFDVVLAFGGNCEVAAIRAERGGADGRLRPGYVAEELAIVWVSQTDAWPSVVMAKTKSDLSENPERTISSGSGLGPRLICFWRVYAGSIER
jgi:hypothetical protein